MKLLKRLYDWVLHWADTPYGTPALFLLALAESSFFPVPPDVLLIALSLAVPRRSFFFAGVCTVGSVTGGMLGYLQGDAGNPTCAQCHATPSARTAANASAMTMTAIMRSKKEVRVVFMWRWCCAHAFRFAKMDYIAANL